MREEEVKLGLVAVAPQSELAALGDWTLKETVAVGYFSGHEPPKNKNRSHLKSVDDPKAKP